MTTENDQAGIRRAIVPILATIGTGLVVIAVVSLLGATWPWLVLILGIVCLFLAVFISAPNTAQFFSPIRIYKGIHRKCIWWCRGPKWTVTKPIISLDEISPSNVGHINYTASLSLTISNRDNYPLEGALYSLTVNIEQKLNRMKIWCTLRPNPSYQIKIPAHQEETYSLVLFGTCGDIRRLDIEKPYNWGIQGITVSLNGVGYKDLHRGLYLKPFRQDYGMLV